MDDIQTKIDDLTNRVTYLESRRVSQSSIPPQTVKSRHLEEGIELNNPIINGNITLDSPIINNATLTSPVINGTLTGTAGFDSWKNWTPSLNNLSGGVQTYAKYIQIGKTVHFRFKYTLGGAGVSGDVSFTPPLPFNSDYSVSGGEFLGIAGLRDVGTQNYAAYCSWGTNGVIIVRYLTLVSGTLISNIGILSSTAPFTWANTDQIYAEGTYETA